MSRRVKLTLRVKRLNSFISKHGLTPQEFLDRLNELPNQVRTKANIKEARAIV